jgi:hypothetical protein
MKDPPKQGCTSSLLNATDSSYGTFVICGDYGFRHDLSAEMRQCGAPRPNRRTSALHRPISANGARAGRAHLDGQIDFFILVFFNYILRNELV